MAITTTILPLNSEKIIELDALTDQVDDSYINDATVTGHIAELEPISLDAGEAVQDATGKPKFKITGHTLTTDDFVMCVGLREYNGTDFAAVFAVETNYVTLDLTYTAEIVKAGAAFYKIVHSKNDAAYDQTMSYVAASDGKYRAIIVDQIPLIEGTKYNVFVIATKDSNDTVFKKIVTANFV